MNRRVRIRTHGGVGAGGNTPATRSSLQSGFALLVSILARLRRVAASRRIETRTIPTSRCCRGLFVSLGVGGFVARGARDDPLADQQGVESRSVGRDRFPRVRAQATQDTLASFSELIDNGRERLVARMPADALAQIDSTPSTGWVPIDVDRHVPAMVVAELGQDGAYAFFRAHCRRQLEISPLLKSTIAATVRLFGLTPASLARAAPVGWDVIFRDFCRVRSTQRGSDSTCVMLENVAAQVFETPEYVDAFRGLIAGFTDFCGVTGDAEATANEQAHTIEIALRWAESQSVAG